MRIGVDATCSWNRRGFGRFTRELLRALAERGGGHRYVLLVDRETRPGELPPGLEVVNARPARTVTSSAVAGGSRSLSDLWAFRRAARRLRPDVFFFPAVYSFFPLPRGLRAVVCFHDTIAESFPQLVFPDTKSRWLWAAKVRVALRQATRVLTVSEASRQSLIRRFGLAPDRVDLVVEAPSPAFRVLEAGEIVRETLARHGIPQDRPYLLHVGGLSPHKNLSSLLEAMKILLRGSDVSLVLAGDAKADGFLDEAARLRATVEADPSLRARCFFTGFVPDEDLVALYNGARALVFPSLCEGFGLPAVEAMACGIPVVASREGALPEVVGPAGLYFDPRSVQEMASQVSRILLTPSLHAELSARALERARSFSWGRAAEMTLESLRRAAA